MTTEPNDEQADDGPTPAPAADDTPSASPPNVRGSLRWILAATVILAVAVTGWNQLIRQRVEVPEVSLDELHPDVQNAIEDARQRVLSRLHSADAWGRLGMLFWVYQFNEQADYCLCQAESLDPSEFRWPYYLGAVRAPTDRAEALAAYQRAAGAEPNIALLRIRVAELLMETGAFEQAESELQVAVAASRQTGHAQFRLAQVLLAGGDVEGALDWARQAAEKAPAQRDTFELLTQIHSRLGETPAAEQAMRRAEALPPTNGVWFDPFVEEARQLRVDPEYAAHRAKLLLASGRLQQAIIVYEALVQKEPAGTQFRTELGQIYMSVGQLERAARLLEDGLEHTPGSAPIVGMLASVYLLQERWLEASVFFRQAIALQPEFAPFRSDLAFCLLRQGKREEAIAAFRKSVELSENRLETMLTVARVLAENGLIDEARRQLEDARQLAPDDATVQRLLESLGPQRQ